jgi:hypothetical protein
MPDIYSSTADCDANTGLQSSWNAARDFNGSATLGAASDNAEAFGAGAFGFAGRGSTTYRVNRSFFLFDTSGITGTVSSATISLYLYGITGNSNVRLIKSTAFGGDGSAPLAATDFDNVDFSTPYTDEHSITDNSYNSIDLNVAATGTLKLSNVLIVALVNGPHDFDDTAPSGNNYASVTFADNSGTAKDPKLSYTLSTGYTHDICGLAAASISKVNTVATANIGKINSLD